MQNSKLVLIIEQILSEAAIYKLSRRQQQNKLRRFVCSPYFTYDHDKNIVALFDYIVKYLPNMEHKAFQKQRVFKALYPDKVFDEKGQQDLRRCMTDLVTIIEHFICVDKKDPTNEMRYYKSLLGFYIGTQQHQYFQQLWNDLHTKHQQQLIRNADFYEQELLLQETWHIELTLRPFNFEDMAQQLNVLSRNLNVFFIIRNLNYYCQFLTLQKSVVIQTSFEISENLIDFIKRGDYLQIPTVALYYASFCLLYYEDGDEYFGQLKELLSQHAETVTQGELNNFYTYAENYCTLQINRGRVDFYTNLFDIYDEQQQNGIILVEGQMDIRKFKNIVTLALRLQRYNYAQQFIDKYRHHIDEKYGDEVYHYSMAAVFFEQRNFEAVLDHLQYAQQDKRFYNIFYRLDSQKLAIKTYYECDEMRLLEAKINAFATFCRNNASVAASVLQANLNFMRIVRKLHHIKEAQKWGDIDQKIEKNKKEIRQILAQETLIAERVWLQQKIAEIGEAN